MNFLDIDIFNQTAVRSIESQEVMDFQTHRVFVAEAENMELECENENLKAQLDSANERCVDLQVQLIKLQQNIFYCCNLVWMTYVFIINIDLKFCLK